MFFVETALWYLLYPHNIGYENILSTRFNRLLSKRQPIGNLITNNLLDLLLSIFEYVMHNKNTLITE